MSSTTVEMEVLHDLAALAVQIASRLGFTPVEWKTLPTKVMWVVTELDELVEAVTQPGDVPSELADIALRTMGILHVLFPDWSVVIEDKPRRQNYKPEIEVVVWPSVRCAARATQAWRKGKRDLVKVHLQSLVVEVFDLSSRLGFDLIEAMERKLETNSRRPHLHGTVEALG